MAAAEKLGPTVRVVSMPCFEIFERQTPAYRESVLPAACERRISIEAGVTQPWYRYVGLRGKVLGIDRFGLSAPGGTVMRELGITADAVVEAGRTLLARG
jgi:transketolase